MTKKEKTFHREQQQVFGDHFSEFHFGPRHFCFPYKLHKPAMECNATVNHESPRYNILKN